MAHPLSANNGPHRLRENPTRSKTATSTRPLTRLALELKKRKLTVMDLSKMTGLDCKYLYRLASGDRSNPSFAYADRIAKALNLSPSLLFYVRR